MNTYTRMHTTSKSERVPLLFFSKVRRTGSTGTGDRRRGTKHRRKIKRGEGERKREHLIVPYVLGGRVEILFLDAQNDLRTATESTKKSSERTLWGTDAHLQRLDGLYSVHGGCANSLYQDAHMRSHPHRVHFQFAGRKRETERRETKEIGGRTRRKKRGNGGMRGRRGATHTGVR